MNLTEIRERAEKATNSKWEVNGDGDFCKVEGPRYTENLCCGCSETWHMVENDAQFIATCNPQTVLALLAHIDRLTFLAKQVIERNDCNYNNCKRCQGGGCDLVDLGILIAEQEASTNED